MQDPRDRWEDEIYEENSGTGLLWQTARNVGILIVLCLLVAGALSLGKSGPTQPATRSDVETPDQEAGSFATRSTSTGEELVIPVGPGGHFLANVEVDGVEMRFLVDTGATRVILSVEDAERLGLRLDGLDFNQRYNTANGVVSGASIVLPEVRIGNLWVEDVDASVIRTPLTFSLRRALRASVISGSCRSAVSIAAI